MEIKKNIEGDKLFIELVGRLDTLSANQLDEQLNDLSQFKEVVFDFKNLSYLSSTGVRILSDVKKQMDAKQGKMEILNTQKEVYDVLDMCYLTEFFGVKKV